MRGIFYEKKAIFAHFGAILPGFGVIFQSEKRPFSVELDRNGFLVRVIPADLVYFTYVGGQNRPFLGSFLP